MGAKFNLFSVIKLGLVFSMVISHGLAQDVLFLTNNSTIHISAGAQLHVKGGVNASIGSSLNNYAEIYLADNAVAAKSDWTDLTFGGVFGSSTGKVFFNGTHAVTGGRFFELSISSLNSTKLASDLSVAKTLELDRGIIETDIFMVDITSNQSNALIAGPANPNFDVGYVRGNLRRAITTNTEIYSFPLAKPSATSSNTLNLINQNVTGPSSLLVNIIDKQGSDVGLTATEFGIQYNSVNDFATWNVVGGANVSSGSFGIQVSLRNFTGLADNSFGLLMRPPGSTNAADWLVPAGSSLPSIDLTGRTIAGGVAIRNDIRSFGQFGIGQALVPLPLELLYFKGEHQTDSNLLSWAVATEVDVDYYSLQKAWNDGVNFDEIGKVPAKNENKAAPTTYVFRDTEILPGISYYMLKMVDLDGKVTFSKVISVFQSDDTALQVFPNPTRDFVKAIYRSAKDSCAFSIINEYGQLMMEGVSLAKGQYQVAEIDLTHFPAGIYFIKLCNSDGKCIAKKIIKI